jgi:hypothetical protein
VSREYRINGENDTSLGRGVFPSCWCTHRADEEVAEKITGLPLGKSLTNLQPFTRLRLACHARFNSSRCFSGTHNIRSSPKLVCWHWHDFVRKSPVQNVSIKFDGNLANCFVGSLQILQIHFPFLPVACCFWIGCMGYVLVPLACKRDRNRLGFPRVY